jgi:hypothetical protein
METAKTNDLKVAVFDTLKSIMKLIDAQTLKTEVMKSLERIRSKETDPKVCMKMLEIYEEIAKILGPEEIAQKILPGIMPMLITGQFTKGEFKSLMSSVRRLLEQIEVHRMKSLPDDAIVQDTFSSAQADPFGSSNSGATNALFAGVAGGSSTNPNSLTTGKDDDSDVFGFLGGSAPTSKPQAA